METLIYLNLIWYLFTSNLGEKNNKKMNKLKFILNGDTISGVGEAIVSHNNNNTQLLLHTPYIQTCVPFKNTFQRDTYAPAMLSSLHTVPSDLCGGHGTEQPSQNPPVLRLPTICLSL